MTDKVISHHIGRSLSTAYKLGCRCEQCVSWQQEKYRKSKESVIGRMSSGEIRHGTGRAYGLGRCRCSLCLEWEYKKRQKVAANGNRHVRQNQWKIHGIGRNGIKFTYAEYERMWNEQKRKCAICDKPIRIVKSEEGNAAAVDHNHSNGMVRGLLCVKCNMGIGQFCDNSWLLRKAAKYLENNRFLTLGDAKTA